MEPEQAQSTNGSVPVYFYRYFQPLFYIRTLPLFRVYGLTSPMRAVSAKESL